MRKSKKKFKIGLESQEPQDLTFYLDILKKESTKIAEDVFSEVTLNTDETFNMTDFFKNPKRKTNTDNNLDFLDVLAQIKKESQSIADEVFKKKA